MNIIVSCLGQSLHFDQKTRHDNAAKKIDNFMSIGIIELLLRNGHSVYYFGRSDLYKCDKNKLPNELHDLTPKISLSKLEKENIRNKIITNHNKLIPKKFNVIKIDHHYNTYMTITDKVIPSIVSSGTKFDLMLFIGLSIEKHNIPFNVVNSSSGTYYSPRLMSINGTSATFNLANTLSDVPVVMLIDDQRSIFTCKKSKYLGPFDLFNTPKLILGQNSNYEDYLTRYKDEVIQNKIPINVRTNLESLINNIKVPYRYCPIETMFLLKENIWANFKDFRSIKKNKKFILTAHGTGKRDQYLAKWVFPYVPDDFKVYGWWWNKSDETRKFSGYYWSKIELYDKYKDRIEPKIINDIENEMWDSRYTFIPAVDHEITNFVTQKFWRTIYYGIIPFCQKEYDTDHLLPIPDFLRPNTPEEMWERIEYLDANPEEYQKILDYLYDVIINPKLKTGEYMYDFLRINIKNQLGLDM
jgi:hypothetical protein